MTSPHPNDADIGPACPHFASCSGCALPGIDPLAEANGKFARLRRALHRALPDAEERVEPLVSPPTPFGLRSRLALRLMGRGDHLRAGLTPREGKGITPIEVCPATDPRAVEAALAVVAEIRERRVEGVRALVAHAAASADLHVTLVAETGRLPHAQRLAEAATAHGATGVSLNVHEGQGRRLFGRRTVPLAGRTVRVERIADLELVLGPTTFFESSAFGAERLVETVRRLAPTELGRVVDLYAGSGLLALALAGRARQVVQVDPSSEAIRDADRSARRHGGQIEVRHGQIDRELTVLGDRPTALAIVDPPVDGCPAPVVAQIARVLRPTALLAIGRNAAHFARDLAGFVAGGYRVEAIVPIDVDPLAREIVTVAALAR